MALAEGGCDFLGSIAQKLELADARSGQFFTPYDVSRLLAEMRSYGGVWVMTV
jgi:hypothetical protein